MNDHANEFVVPEERSLVESAFVLILFETLQGLEPRFTKAKRAIDEGLIRINPDHGTWGQAGAKYSPTEIGKAPLSGPSNTFEDGDIVFLGIEGNYAHMNEALQVALEFMSNRICLPWGVIDPD
jgi:hypothetical protein